MRSATSHNRSTTSRNCSLVRICRVRRKAALRVRKTPTSSIKRSGARVRPRSARAMRSWSPGSRTRARRCSMTARAMGLLKLRMGKAMRTVLLTPSWPASSRATSRTSTSSPAHGWAVKSRYIDCSALRARRDGKIRAKSGAAISSAGPWFGVDVCCSPARRSSARAWLTP